ncbi:MAG: ATP-binding cassette domain-containing protein, partial [Bacteroidota bacterium]|nr:ATP-binding cassette domain-containing protein [Bacteroidota bacterium]
MEILRTENIVKHFQGHTALSGVDIDVAEGEIFGLLGPNGAGKTTLMRIINRITSPDEGTVFFRGKKIQQKDVFGIGYLPEERGLYKKMKVAEQAEYLAQLKGLSINEARSRLKVWLKKFDIYEWRNKKIETLSKGMQQKIQFITTVLHQPKLLIFDEPFSGFDPVNAELLKSEILKLKENGSSVIFSTHNMASVEEICDRIALIHNSKKILSGKVSEVKDNFKDDIYEILFDGSFDKIIASFTADYQIIDIKERNNTSRLRLKILNGKTSNEILSELMKYGNIISFNEEIPKLNEIFIDLVK